MGGPKSLITKLTWAMKETRRVFKNLSYRICDFSAIFGPDLTCAEEKYLNKIRPYLKDSINNLKKSDTCKIQLSLANTSIVSIDNDEERVIHSKSCGIEVIINDEADEVVRLIRGKFN